MSGHHTPGPWTYCDGFIIAEFSDGKVHDICDPRCAPPELRVELDANTLLIGAAPDLLDALRGVMQHCVSPRGMPDKGKGRTREQQMAYDAARNAIAKATKEGRNAT